MDHAFLYYNIGIAFDDFMDEYKERKYLRALWLQKLTRGLFKAKEPVYYYNNGWLD